MNIKLFISLLKILNNFIIVDDIRILFAHFQQNLGLIYLWEMLILKTIIFSFFYKNRPFKQGL